MNPYDHRNSDFDTLLERLHPLLNSDMTIGEIADACETTTTGVIMALEELADRGELDD